MTGREKKYKKYRQKKQRALMEMIYKKMRLSGLVGLLKTDANG